MSVVEKKKKHIYKHDDRQTNTERERERYEETIANENGSRAVYAAA